MPRLYLVRHGKAAHGWSENPDPALDDLGRVQARAVADSLAARGPLALVASPLRRTRETAAPLEAAWGVAARIEPRIREIPSPDPDLPARAAWLRAIMSRNWTDMEVGVRAWRDGILACIREARNDTVFVTHFMVINVLVGHATGLDNVLVCHPDNGSCTEFDNVGGQLRLIAMGREAETRIV